MTGESNIELSHAEDSRLVLDDYLDPGYEGTINAKLTTDSVLNVVQDTKVGP